jgi:hypothetical protein
LVLFLTGSDGVQGGVKTLEATVSQLMAKERVASETEQKSVEKEEEATLELSSAENLKHGLKKDPATKSSSLDIVGKQPHQSVGDLKKEVSKLGKRAATAKVTRNALQRQLDTELNKLSSEQIHAHDMKSPHRAVREGFTETVKNAMAKREVPSLSNKQGWYQGWLALWWCGLG